MKTIGVLGGMGPQATMDFVACVHRVSQKLIPQQGNMGYPPMVVYYFRQVPVIMPADGSMPTSPPPVNPELLEVARKLGTIADFLVITSNGVHHFQSEIEQASGRKVLSMVDAAIHEVKQRQAKTVGIVDFRPATFSVYAPCLDQLGLRWEGTPPDLLDAMSHAVLAVDEGKPGDQFGQPARQALQMFRSKGMDATILGCTEIPFLLPEAGGDPDVINPALLLAEATVRYAMDEK